MSFIRSLLLADTHLGFDYPLRPRVEKQRRGEDFFANFQRVLDYAAQTRPHFVVHTGDLFFRSKIPAPVTDRVYHMLLDFTRHDIPLFIVPGNHERSQLPPSLFLQHPQLHIFDRPRSFFLTVRNTAVALGGFPCVRNGIRDRFRQLLQESGLTKTDAPVKLLCLHQTVEGATVGPADYVFRNGTDVIPRTAIPAELTAVLAGHIHRRQMLDTPSGVPVFYPGSIERTAFAEKDETKGFYELHFSVDNGPARISKRKFWRLPTRPMVELDLRRCTSIEALKKELKKNIPGLPIDSIIRLALNPSLLPNISAGRLREIFPATFNVQLRRPGRVYNR